MRKMNRISNILCAGMILVYVGFLFFSWKTIPNTVPKHFNAAGVPDAYGSKAILIFEPILALLLWGLFAFIRHVPGAWNFPVSVTEKNKEKLYRIGEELIAILAPLIVFLCVYAGLSSIIIVPITVFYLILGIIATAIITCIIRMIKIK